MDVQQPTWVILFMNMGLNAFIFVLQDIMKILVIHNVLYVNLSVYNVQVDQINYASHVILMPTKKTQQPVIYGRPQTIAIAITSIPKTLVHLLTMEYIRLKNVSHAQPFQQDVQDATYSLKNRCLIPTQPTIK